MVREVPRGEVTAAGMDVPATYRRYALALRRYFSALVAVGTCQCQLASSVSGVRLEILVCNHCRRYLSL